MASQGPLYPGTVATEVGPSGANDWLTPGNVSADDAAEAQITAATYDAADHSWRLKATNFGFGVSGSIDGITVEIDRRAFAGAAQDQEVRLYDSTATLVGTDKQTATAWPAALAIATYGGAADTWAAGLDAADINSSAFGVSLIVLADAANTDIGVDFIRVTVNYTPPIDTTVTPGTGTLTLTGYTPTVTATSHVLVTPGTASLTTARFAPTVLAPRLVTPGAASLTTARFAPTVTLGYRLTPGAASLGLTAFTPTVTVSGGGAVLVTPGTATLVTARFAPIVTTTNHQLVTPGAAALALTAFAPTVTSSDPVAGPSRLQTTIGTSRGEPVTGMMYG